MLNQGIIFIFSLLVLLFSAILHEISHGISAKLQGDNTAEAAGRLTLNPLPHLDLLGSIILPLALALPALFGAPVFIIGWAKPVPFNPHNLKSQKLMIIIWINLLLAVFNLIPIPPLDGSKLLFSILPPSWMGVEVWLERYGFFLLLLFIFFGFELIFPVIKLLFRVVSGRFFGF
ncbi:MAG: Peptidase M50 [Candidatus Azambacteria bacterium GW2011_GWA2_42_62]|nr:MAG: Peptidase M50 [Candidatus Azambacteria bacterium GW2011_GWA2_42_62]